MNTFIIEGPDAGRVDQVRPDLDRFVVPRRVRSLRVIEPRTIRAEWDTYGDTTYLIDRLFFTVPLLLPTVPPDRFIQYGIEWLDWLPKSMIEWHPFTVNLEYRVAAPPTEPESWAKSIIAARCLLQLMEKHSPSRRAFITPLPGRQILDDWETMPSIRREIVAAVSGKLLEPFWKTARERALKRLDIYIQEKCFRDYTMFPSNISF